MNEYQEQYENRRKEVLDFLDESIDALEQQERDGEDFTSYLKKLRSNVADGLFSIVLVGEFSSGKSTFLNALMRRRILPTFSDEATATVNFLCHTSRAPDGEAGVVYYRDPAVEKKVLHKLNPTVLEQVVSTRGNTDEQQIATSVDHVDLFLDSEFLRDGVMLVDSPGLNGVADHHREITEDQVKASHACIFLFSADHPGSKTDFEYLRELKQQSNNIFFVLNKIDRIKKSEGETAESVVDGLRDTYRKQFPDDKTLPKIWPVSAGAALVARDHTFNEFENGEIVTTQERRDELEAMSRMGEFEARLWRYLTEGERAHDQLCSPVNSVLNDLRDRRDSLETLVKALKEQQGADELKDKRESLEDKIRELEENRKSAVAPLRKRVNNALRDIEEKAGSQFEKLREKVERELGEFQKEEDIEDYNKRLTANMNASYMRIVKKLDEELRGELMNIIAEEYENYVDELEDKLSDTSGQTDFKFSSREHILSNISSGINFEAFENKCQKLKERIAVLEKETERNQEDLIRAKRLERDIREKKDALRSYEDSMRDYRQNFVIPEVVTREKDSTKKVWRGGLLGIATTILFGKKEVVEKKYDPDSSAHDEAKRERDAELSRMQEECSLLKKELNDALSGSSGEDSEVIQLKMRRSELELERKEKELREMEEKFQREAKESSERVCRKLRNEILDSLEDEAEEAVSAIKTHLQGLRSGYVRTVQDTVAVSLNQELERKQKELDELIRLLEAGAEERDKELRQSEEAIKNLEGLMNKGSELCAKLEESMKDHIEEENL